MRVLGIAALLALPLLTACEDAPPPPVDLARPGDLGTGSPDLSGSSDGAVTPIELADFVIQLITTQTSDSTRPTTTEDKTFVDSMDPMKLQVLFQ